MPSQWGFLEGLEAHVLALGPSVRSTESLGSRGVVGLAASRLRADAIAIAIAATSDVGAAEDEALVLAARLCGEGQTRVVLGELRRRRHQSPRRRVRVVWKRESSIRD